MSECSICKAHVSRDEVGLSIKLFGRNCREAYCLECISKRLDVKPHRLLEIIEIYRADGCQLFADENSSGVI